MKEAATWPAGNAPVAVVMISLNEGHNMDAALRNISGWAQQVFLVDSYSQDNTIDIALRYRVHVVQRKFRGFGDQWNFALRELPIDAPWTMKLDPDERLSDTLKVELSKAMQSLEIDGCTMNRRLWFMGRRLPVSHSLLRAWRTGKARFTDVSVNEHPVMLGHVKHVRGELEHHDSPDLEHWLEKQNRYTTAEAMASHQRTAMADTPKLLGTSMQRRMWMKRYYFHIPFRFGLFFLYHYVVLGAWRAGWVGYAWSRLRADVYRYWEYKLREIQLTGRLPTGRAFGPGAPDPRVQQRD